MSIELKKGSEDAVKEKLYDITFNYYSKIYKGGIHAPVLRGRFEAAKEFSLMFIPEDDVEDIISQADLDAKERR